MTWVLLLGLLGLVVLGGTGSDRRLRRFRPTGKRRRPKFRPPTGGRRASRGLQLDLPTPFASGEFEGTIPQDYAGTVSFNLGDIPEGDVVYTATVEFEGDGVRGHGFYRLIIEEQPGGMSEIQSGPVMSTSTGEHWLPAALKLSAYLVDPDRGPVGFSGFSLSSGRMLFSVAQSTLIPLEGVVVRVKWYGFET